MRWTLNAEKEISILCKSDPGNLDLLRTMPLPDCAGITGSLVPSNIGAMRGGVWGQIVCKFDRVKKPGLMTGTGQYMRGSPQFLLERDRCGGCSCAGKHSTLRRRRNGSRIRKTIQKCTHKAQPIISPENSGASHL